MTLNSHMKGMYCVHKEESALVSIRSTSDELSVITFHLSVCAFHAPQCQTSALVLRGSSVCGSFYHCPNQVLSQVPVVLMLCHKDL